MISSRSLDVGRDTKLFMTFPLPPSTCACRVCRGAGEKGRVAATNTKDRALLPGGSWRRLQTQAFPPRSNSRNGPDRFAEGVASKFAGKRSSPFHHDFLFLNTLSISSKKTMQGLQRRARWKMSRMRRSLSPISLHTNSEIWGHMKFRWPICEHARRIAVFPVPGGPYRRMPVGGEMWKWRYFYR